MNGGRLACTEVGRDLHVQHHGSKCYTSYEELDPLLGSGAFEWLTHV